jgi:hypothetical protein
MIREQRGERTRRQSIMHCWFVSFEKDFFVDLFLSRKKK